MGAEEHSCATAGSDLSLEELDQRDQDYRADLDHNQRPSNIIMLRMLPPNATANEVCLRLPGMFVCLQGSIEMLIDVNGNNFSVFLDSGTTPGAGDPAKRGSPHEEQIFR